MEQNKDKYTIGSVTKGITEKGANYYEISAVDNETGEIVNCIYFGNTKPKRLLDIVKRETETSVWHLAVIQPHTSRDKKTGRFIKGQRRTI